MCAHSRTPSHGLSIVSILFRVRFNLHASYSVNIAANKRFCKAFASDSKRLIRFLIPSGMLSLCTASFFRKTTTFSKSTNKQRILGLKSSASYAINKLDPKKSMLLCFDCSDSSRVFNVETISLSRSMRTIVLLEPSVRKCS